MYRVTNISGGQLVFNLPVSGETVRFDNREDFQIQDADKEGYLTNLESKNLVKCEHFDDSNSVEDAVEEDQVSVATPTARKRKSAQ